MGRGDENSRGTGSNGVPMEGVKFASQLGGNNRRRLRDIGNMVGAQPYPSAASKSKVPMDHKNPQNFVGRRPMTRKFAASLEGKSQACHEDPSARHEHVVSIQKPTPSVLSSTGSDDDRYELPDDFPLPMIEEIEEMVNCELKEVEMEDLEVEPLMDIDVCDSSNPLAVVDYVEDIYSFYRQTEDLGCVCPNYMSNQFDINEKMRAILIDWLIEVHYKFELMDETLFLTVNIIDRFLARQTVVRKKLQLVGVTAMLLACKYEEVSVPIVDDFILISDRAYTKGEVLEMERLMVNTLQFNMSLPTPYVFMRRFFKAAQSNKEVELLSFFIIELCLVEFQMLKFRPSLLAAAAIYTAQCALKGFKYWSRTSELHASYSEDQLLECSRMMVDFHQKAGVGKLTGVHRKYSTFRFGYAAKTEPALFLLETGL